MRAHLCYVHENPHLETSLSCDSCGYAAHSLEDLRNHVENHHMELEPVIGAESSTSHEQLNFPALAPNMSDAEQCIYCLFCANTFSSMRDLHIQTVANHGAKLKLSSTLGSIEDMKTHIAIHHDVNSFYSCTMCNRTFSTLQAFKDHLNFEHNIVGVAPWS